eukprot:Protomagalhaensia_sp_Gyna_25__3781@NODE_339_length_3817_cov_120_097935_g265_i0_p1_GENE_NODE_339_length_3817_cov_120_097935_g265_i0NODE_339_length_3817_cov_120_097935_g265_i0_p1_ORF_typecomplete_len781_score171_12TPR_16/PF13432_6/1e06TPR_16/PF13432_6/0_024TPR_16/PF13432_6/4_5e07TPR_16/PF13432_6/2_9e12TPR_16/PF13432_6/0_00064TPR_16/PF13432_6/2_6e05TPR_16/PF13432_6/4_1e08TPR_16/PF13432_6/1_4e11TPR_16/PF13432_6/1_2e06TPR_16/PF13432_6/6_9e06TPR_15/PF13429_6/1_7e09TPR_15/PF13429_6/1_3e05TPR_15/PF13429
MSTSRSYTTQGLRAMETRNYEAAIDHFTTALRHGPYPEIFANRSEAHAALGQYEEALHDAENCIKAAPNRIDGYIRMGSALMGLQRYMEASEVYKKGLAQDPRNKELQEGLDLARERVDDFEMRIAMGLMTDPTCNVYANEDPNYVSTVQSIIWSAMAVPVAHQQAYAMGQAHDERTRLGVSKALATLSKSPAPFSLKGKAVVAESGLMYGHGSSLMSLTESSTPAKSVDNFPSTLGGSQKLSSSAVPAIAVTAPGQAGLVSDFRPPSALGPMASRMEGNTMLQGGSTMMNKSDVRVGSNVFGSAKPGASALIGTDSTLPAGPSMVGAPTLLSASRVPGNSLRIGSGFVSGMGVGSSMRLSVGDAWKSSRSEATRHLGESVRVSLNARDYDKALSAAKAAEKKDPAAGWNLKGSVYDSLHRFKQAKEAYEEAIRRNPTEPVFYHNKGRALRRLGEPAAALKDAEKALELDPSDPDFWNAKGLCHDMMNDRQAAKGAFEEALRRNQNNPVYSYNVGKTCFQLSEYSTALKHSSRATEIDASEPEFWNLLGACRDLSKDFHGAENAFNRAIALDSGNAVYFHNRCKARRHKQDLKQAAEDATRATELNPMEPEFWNIKGMCHDQLRDTSVARDCYSKAIDLNAQNPVFFYNRSKAARTLKDYQSAIADAEQTVRLGPNNPEFWALRGICHDSLKEHQAAKESFDRAISLAPNSPLYYYNRGKCLLYLRQPQLALADVSKAVELNPRDGVAWSLKSQCHDQLKQHNEAQAARAQAAQLGVRAK